MGQWVAACAVDDVEEEDLIRFDHAGHSYAIYKSPEGAFFATDGMCTHERTCLADGLVMGAGGIVIIGAGESGARAALALRAEGYREAITLVGAERHLPYERPPLSKGMLLGEGVTPIATAEQLQMAEIRMLQGTQATAI